MMFQLRRFSAARVLAVGFALIILLGACLLTLPGATRGPGSQPFSVSLFTAVSATCVTGLVVVDTYSQYTFFGQLVVILLIQLGGLGFMTFAILFAMALGKKIGLKERTYMMEAMSSLQLGGMVRLTRHILFGTLLIEGFGALLLSFRFVPAFGWAKGIWFSIFHAVSAFCNAGFDLIGIREPYSSLVSFSGDPLVILTIGGLIVIGGIGFLVWEDILHHGIHFRHYSLHARTVLCMTGLIIIIPALLFLFTERNTVFVGMPWGDRIVNALFSVITPRTAGFNSVDVASMSEAGTLMTILLMMVGAAPGSTGGGMKVSLIAVVMAAVYAWIKGDHEVNLFNRRVDPLQVRKAYSSGAFYLIMAFTGVFLIMIFQNEALKDTVFECFSALSTVGLTTGVTREMSFWSRVVLMILMYAGRVGSLTIFMAVSEKKNTNGLRNPTEQIMM